MADHPITPPPELVQQWDSEAVSAEMPWQLYIATQAARWGADQELEACCEWVEREIGHGREWNAELRAAMRPKPPSLKVRIAEAIAKGDKHQALRLLDEALSDE